MVYSMCTQITYTGFCTLGALTNPKLFTKQVYLGKHFMFTTYWMIN